MKKTTINSFLIILSLLFIVTSCGEENTSITCGDGIDNDGDSFIDCDDEDCQNLKNKGCEISSNGIYFADELIEYIPGCTKVDPMPEGALGVSDYNGNPSDEDSYVFLGEGGSIKLGFTNNTLTNSGNNGFDVYIFEVGPIVEASDIALRPSNAFTKKQLIDNNIPDANADGFYEIGSIKGSIKGFDVDAVLKGFPQGSLLFNAIEIKDIPDECYGDSPGADIDAVCTLSSSNYLPVEDYKLETNTVKVYPNTVKEKISLEPFETQNKNPLQAINEISDTDKQLKILEEALIDNQYANPKVMYKYATAYDSIAKIVNIEYIKVNALNFMGNANYVNENYTEAISYYIEATQILETKKPSKMLSQTYNNLAGCYRSSNDFENIEKYFNKALKIAIDIDDEPWIANVSNNLAVVYKDNEMFNKASKMYETSLGIYEQVNDTLMIGVTYMNQGNLSISSKNYSEAITEYSKAQKYVTIKRVPLLHSVSQTGIGIALTKQKKYDNAFPYLIKGKEIAEDISDFEQLKTSNAALSDYYSETNNYKKAFDLYKESFDLLIENKSKKDSIETITEKEILVNRLAKYDTEKKDAELKVLKLEAEQSSQEKLISIIAAITGVSIAMIIAFFLFKNFKKNKLLKKQTKLLETSIDEKNVLLKETHHRVKNSFQIVSSLLYLQSESAEDKEAKVAIKEAENRVRSMVLIHQRLYNKDELVGINTKDYFNDLVTDIFESHQFESNSITYSLDVEPLILDIETITPIGLILNELIVNTLKHAFDVVNSESKIAISFKKENKKLCLKITDNGKGFNGEIKNTSFGITLMKALSKKLDATLDYDSKINEGTEATLVITKFKNY